MHMGDQSQQKHFQELGSELQKIRLKNRQSIAEVSGSVEIDIEELARYENGESRPPEEILLLLISHFNLSEEKAGSLWQLAGYSKDEPRAQDFIDELHQAGAFVLPQDARILFTDVTHASANQHGVTINFMQSAGPMGKPMIVSRMGMSREHAENLRQLLDKILHEEKPSPKLLAPPKDESTNTQTDSTK
jgi:transcriptional regulator with XRE-family HTH domain